MPLGILRHCVRRLGREAALMETELRPTTHPERKPPWSGIWKVFCFAVFLALLVLLAQSMVEHRFFQGERVHSNGSIGQ